MITLRALIAGRIKESRWSSPGHGINNYLLIKALGTEHLFLVGYNLCSVTRLHIILLLFFPLSLENKVLIYDVDPSATWPTPPPRRGQIAHPCYFLSHYRMNYIFEAVLWRWGGKKERREKGERKKKLCNRDRVRTAGILFVFLPKLLPQNISRRASSSECARKKDSFLHSNGERRRG